jgi:ferric-dicitrate binding protein FerR (iron transport regulator)
MPKKEIIKMILRQLNQEGSATEREQFSNWLMETPENLDQYIEMKQLWETPFNIEKQFDESKALQRLHAASQKKKTILGSSKAVLQIAAMVIILLTTGSYLLFYRQSDRIPPATRQKIALITKKSNPGEQMRVTLPDESVVWLNAESTLSYPEKFEDGHREVILSGEAFFEVTKNPQRPFIVHTYEMTTTVLGTSFNIKAFDDQEATVTVATGKVRVAHPTTGNKTDEIYLLPNQQAVWSQKSGTLQKKNIDAENYYAWKNGTICFNNETLGETMHMLERWYNVSIKLNTGNSENRHYINGNYKDKKLYNILDGLCYIYDLEYEYLNDRTILISKKLKS